MTKTRIATSILKKKTDQVSGGLVSENDELFYRIENSDQLPPFLMSIVSDSDHWMFIGSNGGMTAGRKNPDNALFPYYTDDKILESKELSGSKTIIRVTAKDGVYLWEPFSDRYNGLYLTKRNLYKSISGNKIIFEEENLDLQFTFREEWMNSDSFGWVRETHLINNSDKQSSLTILDGIMNILPSGILKSVQDQYSTLMDAYKKSELALGSSLAIYSLSSIPVDRAEPSEALKATTVWSIAENVKAILLGNGQINSFRETGTLSTETNNRGIRGSYFISREVQLSPGQRDKHYIVADTEQDSTSVHDLYKLIRNEKNILELLTNDIERGNKKLFKMVALADGIQDTSDRLNCARHFSNVMFNIMRGGIFYDSYWIEKVNLKEHFKIFNKRISRERSEWIESLPDKFLNDELISKAKSTGNPDLIRICLEYLPVCFSRRHGDPSRPWNRFSIDVKNAYGEDNLSYEGNWRDIFQNWEALSWSYPGFLWNIISKFLNASTADGYNPYRITNSGIDWEVFDPSDPWSFIGYWGDHQVIYILRLIELYKRFYPGRIENQLEEDYFVFASVPYRIKSYDEILQNSYKTIDFDEELHHNLLKKSSEIGADGKLYTDKDGNIVKASLIEKFLVSILTKLSNFIPGGGIWMNTQRPEWNDANNALVGHGVSMVTLYYLRRYLVFLKETIQGSGLKNISIFKSLAIFMDEILAGLKKLAENPWISEDNPGRKEITDILGTAGSAYRNRVYTGLSTDRVKRKREEIIEFLEISLEVIDQTIRLNKRKDKLYHAYNLLKITPSGITIENLPLMLEGQVAVLSSGYTDPDEIIDLCRALKESELYRPDQNSYMLYPEKKLPDFLDKNNLPSSILTEYPVLKSFVNGGIKDILKRDDNGNIHFCKDFRNKALLEEKILEKIENGQIEKDSPAKDILFDLYEKLFNHHSFTGRSGSFYKYEGLGSIYWHMVSKLLLAIGENIVRLENDPEAKKYTEKLKPVYTEIRKGIGIHKKPEEYGAIPTDPYSHTPSMLGAQQPGMTGQVKEDIISRWIELGIRVNEGSIRINPGLLQNGEKGNLGSIRFSFCNTPFSYESADKNSISVFYSDGKKVTIPGLILNTEITEEIAGRTGRIIRIIVNISQDEIQD